MQAIIFEDKLIKICQMWLTSFQSVAAKCEF